MRPTALRQILLVMLAGLAGPGCAKEDMLMHKVDVHEVFADSRTAEMADAIADDDARRVHALAKTTDLCAHGDDNVTLLEWAVFNKSKQAFKALLEEGADPALPGMGSRTVAHMAAMVNDPYYLDTLLEFGLDPNLKSQASGTPLLSASLMGESDAQFEHLLKAGANVNAADNTGDTPLHVAAQTNNIHKVLELLDAGADPRAINGQKVTFQDYLAMGNRKILLPEAQADLAKIEAWLRERSIPVHQGK